MAYNLCLGGADRVEEIHSVLAATAADAVALTEADNPQVVAGLAARLGMQHVWAEGSGDRHIALLSRFPITSWRIYNRPPLTQAVLETTLDLRHVTSFDFAQDRRDTSHISRVTLYSVHFLPYLLLPFEIRRAQAVNGLLGIIRRHQPGPHLILGDVNAIAPGDRVLQRSNPARMRRVMALQGGLVFHTAISRLLRAGYVDCYRAMHPPTPSASSPDGMDPLDGFTWMTGNRTTRYDYIFADSQLAPRLRQCWVVDDIPAVEKASDHYPLMACFELP